MGDADGAHPVLPQFPERCAVCGAPRASGDDVNEGVWMIDHPRWAHPACVDWSKEPFPYEWKLKYLRAMARALLGAYDAIVRVGLYVAETKAQWPESAHQRLKRIKEGDTAVHQALSKLRDRLDKR